MAPYSASEPKGKILDALNTAFGSVIAFKEAFSKAAMTDLVQDGPGL